MKQRVLVLGGAGMLGSMVADYLARETDLELAATTRSEQQAMACREHLPSINWHTFDASSADASGVPGLFKEYDWIINCIGIIKPLIHDDNATEVEQSLRVNSLFPHLLARWTEGRARVLQIATDCVYSGSKGRYTETDAHDPLDVYGKTKSLGEVYAPHVHHLRCSIIGPEMKSPRSLMEWFLGQPQGGAVNGFMNHSWNGVTTLHFAKLCAGVIKESMTLPHMQHVIPGETISKCEMLQEFARSYGRTDVTINPTEAATVIDRTLATNNDGLNRELWAAAGYAEKPPTVPQMIQELSQFDYRLKARKHHARN
jgi:dTDP-4-dehydrorhamnose reductase